ncbi:MAG: lipase [Cyanobacteriota bacterium]|nr:lipase [Cyanobacteriota bacterium]
MAIYPTVILPGYLAGARDYFPLQQALEESGCPSRVVPLRVKDWIPTLGGRAVTPILQALQATIAATQAEFASPKVNLVGHSAGGWIARIYLGSVPYHGQVWAGRRQIASLVTLGSPHTSQERWTLTNLNFVNDHYPGAFWPEISYVCIAGESVLGCRWRWTSLPQPWLSWLAYSSYQLTVGVGDIWGDGITPISAAHLDGATNLTIPGIFHSSRGGRPWYGSPPALNTWSGYLQ